jgi:hypothetical protein
VGDRFSRRIGWGGCGTNGRWDEEGIKVKRSSRIFTVLAIITDVHFWVPVVVLILGTALLMILGKLAA